MRLAGVSYGVGWSTGRRDDRGFTAEWVEQSRAGKKELAREVAQSARGGETHAGAGAAAFAGGWARGKEVGGVCAAIGLSRLLVGQGRKVSTALEDYG